MTDLKQTIYEGHEIDTRYIPPIKKLILCADTEKEIMNWIDGNPNREYKNILHSFTIKGVTNDN